ncbi:MAG: hypothetical protein ABIH52_00835 [Candidatus Aenigmatarchaeota archaeon]|nr:hypothetical protein [Nanoarchaeota archaeon]
MGKENSAKKTDLVTLLEIKHAIEKSSLSLPQNRVEYMNRIHTDIEALSEKFDELKEFVVGIKKKGESPKKIRTKREIINLLKKHKKLGPVQLAKLIDLSRVRANEYLRELELESIVKGVKVGRNRFYMLEGDIGKSIVNVHSEESME